MNRTLTAALAAAALTIPLAAHANPQGSMPPRTSHCQGAANAKMQKQIDKWGPELGGADTRKAWKKLVDQGESGCDVILEFLKGEATGMEAADFADLGKDMIMGGSERYITVAAEFIKSGDETIIRGVLKGLETRLWPLTPEQAEIVANHDDDAVREGALGALIGYHREGTMQFTYGVPHFKETAFWGATAPPPEHHLSAVKAIVARDIPDHNQKVAQYVERLYLEGNANQEPWGDVLLEFIGKVDGDRLDQAAIAAKAIGYGEPPATDKAIELVLGPDHARVVQFLIEGLGERLKLGRGTKGTLTRLETIQAGTQHAKWQKTAEQLIKKYSKRIN